MKNIKYKFVDGTIKTIEVEDSFYEEYQKLETETKSLERKETRRHISINVFEEKGIEFEDASFDLENSLIEEESKNQVLAAIKKLNSRQQNLIFDVFYKGKTLSEIAKTNGVSKSAITQQMQLILRKLKEILKNFQLLP